MAIANPEIMKWARETAGISLKEASEKLGLKDNKSTTAIEKLTSIELGELAPTKILLEKMAKKYRRPIIVFYMPEIPIRGNRGTDFRVLPTEYSHVTDALVDTLIRDIQVRQRIIRSTLEDEEVVPNLHFINSITMDSGKSHVLQLIKDTIDLDLLDFRKKPNPQEAFNLLRKKIEEAGIFVLLIGDLGSHHTKIGVEYFRGFSLADEIAPFIVINDNDAKSAWSFTLIHELVHLFLGHTSISSLYFEAEIEQFCNDIASDFLLPKDELSEFDDIESFGLQESINKIGSFAYKRNISGSMVAYKLFRNGLINKKIWLELNTAFKTLWQQNKESEKSKQNKGGPNYYVVHRSYIGVNLINLVQRMVLSGALSSTKAGKVLGVNAKNIQGMFNYKAQYIE